MQSRVFAGLLHCFLILLASVPTRAQENALSLPKLPDPRGSFGVGRVAFDWIDPNRPADMAGDRGSHGELMVYLWYPTDAKSKEAKAPLFPGAEQIDSSPDVSAFLKNKMFGGNWPLVVSGAIKSHAQENAPVANSPKTFPVVLFSPGANGSSFQYSSAIEDLVRASELSLKM